VAGRTAPALAVVAVFVFTLGVGRPLRQLDRAISELGQGPSPTRLP